MAGESFGSIGEHRFVFDRAVPDRIVFDSVILDSAERQRNNRSGM
jgi:hypothetical protein